MLPESRNIDQVAIRHFLAESDFGKTNVSKFVNSAFTWPLFEVSTSSVVESIERPASTRDTAILLHL